MKQKRVLGRTKETRRKSVSDTLQQSNITGPDSKTVVPLSLDVSLSNEDEPWMSTPTLIHTERRPATAGSERSSHRKQLFSPEKQTIQDLHLTSPERENHQRSPSRGGSPSPPRPIVPSAWGRVPWMDGDMESDERLQRAHDLRMKHIEHEQEEAHLRSTQKERRQEERLMLAERKSKQEALLVLFYVLRWVSNVSKFPPVVAMMEKRVAILKKQGPKLSRVRAAVFTIEKCVVFVFACLY